MGFQGIYGDESWLIVILTGYKWGYPKTGWFTMEHPIKIDDLGYPYFTKPPYISQVVGGQKISGLSGLSHIQVTKNVTS